MPKGRAVLTVSCASLAAWRVARVGTAAACSIIMLTAVATADGDSHGIGLGAGVAAGGCTGSRHAINCVVRWGAPGDPYIRVVPQPTDDVEKKHAAERDREWQQRCKPVIAQDRYGVPRYQYAAAGCEFGVIR